MTPMEPARPSDRIAGFDGLRALAFLAVFANHKLGIPQRDALGAVGVWTFFALSGFLITRILARAREDVEAGRSAIWPALRRFYLRRTARIFPVYYALLSTALILSLFVYVDDFWIREKLAYIFYATNILIGMRGGWIGDFGHLWSLAVEEQYYLLFAPLVLLLPRRGAAPLCVAMMAAGLATFVALHMAHAPLIVVYVNPLVNFGLLGFGGLVGLASLKPGSGAVPAWLTGGPAQAATAACLIAGPMALGGWLTEWLTYGPAIVLLAGLLLFQVFHGQGSWFVALLETAPLRLVGRVSYAAYLFHPFIHFSTLQHVLGAGGLRLQAPHPVQVLVELAATLLLCAVSWRLLEAPVIRWAAEVNPSGSVRAMIPVAGRGAAGLPRGEAPVS